jgi:hypothetical protein
MPFHSIKLLVILKNGISLGSMKKKQFAKNVWPPNVDTTNQSSCQFTKMTRNFKFSWGRLRTSTEIWSNNTSTPTPLNTVCMQFMFDSSPPVIHVKQQKEKRSVMLLQVTLLIDSGSKFTKDWSFSTTKESKKFLLNKKKKEPVKLHLKWLSREKTKRFRLNSYSQEQKEIRPSKSSEMTLTKTAHLNKLLPDLPSNQSYKNTTKNKRQNNLMSPHQSIHRCENTDEWIWSVCFLTTNSSLGSRQARRTISEPSKVNWKY